MSLVHRCKFVFFTAGEGERASSECAARSQIIWVDDGEVRVFAVGGALVWAGGARGDHAGDQGVLEAPGQALGLQTHRAPPPPDGRRGSASSFADVPPPGAAPDRRRQFSLLGHQDVVVKVLPLWSCWWRHLVGGYGNAL